MRKITIAIVLISILKIYAVETAAQNWHGFVTGGAGSIDYGPGHRDVIGQASVGVLRRIGSERFSLGGQLDILISNGYGTARGGVLTEAAPIGGETFRPFVDGGYFVGDGGGLWIAGFGVDVMRGRYGIRIFIQDAIRSSRVESVFGVMSRTIHEPAFQVGLSWRR